jgi:hypothetical protein
MMVARGFGKGTGKNDAKMPSTVDNDNILHFILKVYTCICIFLYLYIYISTSLHVYNIHVGKNDAKMP